MLAHLRVALFRNFESVSRTMFITGRLQPRDRLMLHLVCLRLRDSKRFRLNIPILWLLPRMMAYATSVGNRATVLPTIVPFSLIMHHVPLIIVRRAVENVVSGTVRTC